MKPETVIAALRHCSVRGNSCRECPMYNQDSGCLDRLHAQAAELLESQKQRIIALEKELRNTSACHTCAHNSTKCHKEIPVPEPKIACGSYEWRGKEEA